MLELEVQNGAQSGETGDLLQLGLMKPMLLHDLIPHLSLVFHQPHDVELPTLLE